MLFCILIHVTRSTLSYGYFLTILFPLHVLNKLIHTFQINRTRVHTLEVKVTASNNIMSV